MRLFFTLILFLCFNLKAVEIENLSLENSTLGQLLEILSEKSGKKLKLKCELPKEKRHWLFSHVSLEDALNCATDEFSIYYALNDSSIIIDKKRVTEKSDKVYSILTNDLFLNHLTQNPKLLETLTRGCSDVNFNKKILSFSTSNVEFKALNKALKVLGYVDVKKEMLTTLRLKKTTHFDGELIQELKVKNSGVASVKLPGDLGVCVFEVFNAKYDITGQCNYDFKFTCAEGAWSQNFSSDLNSGQIEITPGIYVEVFPTYFLDGEEMDSHNFSISKHSSSTEKQQEVLSTKIPELKIEDEEIAKTIKRLEQLLRIPISLTYCSKPSRPDELIDPSEKATKKAIANLNLDVEEIPIGELLKYCIDHWGLNFTFTENSLKLIKNDQEKTQRKALYHKSLTRSLYRISDLMWNTKKEEFLNYKKMGNDKKRFKEFLNDILFSFFYKIEILEIFEEQKMILCSGYYDVPYINYEVPSISVRELEFSNEDVFKKFKVSGPSRVLEKHIDNQLINNEITKSNNISILEIPGKTHVNDLSLEYSKDAIKYYSKQSKRSFVFKHGKPVYAEIRHNNGRITLIFQPSKFEYKEPFTTSTLLGNREDSTKLKSLSFKDKDLKELIKKLRKDYPKEIVKPLILRVHSHELYGPVTNIEADPFAESDPFAVEHPHTDDEEVSLSEIAPLFKPLNHKFSLNLQNFSTYDFYSSLAYMLGLRIHFDDLAVIMGDDSSNFGCGITKFYAVSRDIIEQLGFDKHFEDNHELVSVSKKEELFFPLHAGETMAYLAGVERFVITSSNSTQQRIETLFSILDKELKNVKFNQDFLKIPEDSTFQNDTHLISNTKNNIRIKTVDTETSFCQSLYRKVIIKQAEGGWIDKVLPNEKQEALLKKLIIPEIDFDSPNLNAALFQLSKLNQSLKFPTNAINLIGPLYGRPTVYRKSFKDSSVWEILIHVANHYKLDVATSPDFTILTSLKYKFYTNEVRLMSLKKSITDRGKFLDHISLRVKNDCLYLSSKEIENLKSALESDIDVETNIKCRFKFLKNSSNLIIFGPVSQLNFLEKELRQKNLISENNDLTFSLFKDHRKIYSFDQSVSTNETVIIKAKDSWELSLAFTDDNYELVFKSHAGEVYKKLLQNSHLKQSELIEGYSIKFD